MIVKNLTKYAFLGTFILIFTIGCSVLKGDQKEGEGGILRISVRAD